MRKLSFSQKLLVTTLLLINILLLCMMAFSYIHFTKKGTPIVKEEKSLTIDIFSEASGPSEPVSLESIYVSGTSDFNSPIAEEAPPKETSYYLLPESNSRYLIEDDLYDFSEEDLRYARNEIYARHGYVFQDEALQSYFSSQSWYSENIEAANDSLTYNAYEKANSELIQSLETRYNEMK